jgi:antitoxin VapB
MQAESIAKAKLFQSGRSQAVRLPKEFRFEGTEVFVRRMGDEVVLSTHPKASMRVLIDALDEFEPGVQVERHQPGRADRREPIGPKRPR